MTKKKEKKFEKNVVKWLSDKAQNWYRTTSSSNPVSHTFCLWALIYIIFEIIQKKFVSFNWRQKRKAKQESKTKTIIPLFFQASMLMDSTEKNREKMFIIFSIQHFNFLLHRIKVWRIVHIIKQSIRWTLLSKNRQIFRAILQRT